MKYLDEYRNKGQVSKLTNAIKRIAGKEPITLMEVCGTHTMAIFRYGIKKLLPSNIKLISGPGCPVCVSPNSIIDLAVAYSKSNDIIICTFGDMVRVPGSSSSLEKEKARGADIRIVNSPLDSIDIALANKNSKVVFIGVGFETTTPPVAIAIKEAQRRRVRNFYVLCGHKIIPPAIKVLLQAPDLKVDGFLLPGHVSTVLGLAPYEFMSKEFKAAGVIAGFEPQDVLEATYLLVSQIRVGVPKVEIQYRRAVRPQGNQKARDFINEVFDITDSEWRGIGIIKDSGLKIKPSFSEFDAELKIDIQPEPTKQEKGCICGEILQGRKSPPDCKLFSKICTPSDPKGACMVSSEGTCAAWWKYNG